MREIIKDGKGTKPPRSPTLNHPSLPPSPFKVHKPSLWWLTPSIFQPRFTFAACKSKASFSFSHSTPPPSPLLPVCPYKPFPTSPYSLEHLHFLYSQIDPLSLCLLSPSPTDLPPPYNIMHFSPSSSFPSLPWYSSPLIPISSLPSYSCYLFIHLLISFPSSSSSLFQLITLVFLSPPPPSLFVLTLPILIPRVFVLYLTHF